MAFPSMPGLRSSGQPPKTLRVPLSSVPRPIPRPAIKNAHGPTDPWAFRCLVWLQGAAIHHQFTLTRRKRKRIVHHGHSHTAPTHTDHGRHGVPLPSAVRPCQPFPQRPALRGGGCFIYSIYICLILLHYTTPFQKVKADPGKFKKALHPPLPFGRYGGPSAARTQPSSGRAGRRCGRFPGPSRSRKRTFFKMLSERAAGAAPAVLRPDGQRRAWEHPRSVPPSLSNLLPYALRRALPRRHAVLRPDGPVLSVAYESTQSTRRRDFHSPTGGFLRKSPLHPPGVPIRL